MSLFGAMPSPTLIPEQPSIVLIQAFIRPPFLSLSRHDDSALTPNDAPAVVDDFGVKQTQQTVQTRGWLCATQVLSTGTRSP